MSGENAVESKSACTLDVGGYWFELVHKAPYEALFTADKDVLGFAFESQSGHHAFSSDRIRPFRTKPNSLAFTPRGCEVFPVSSGGGEYLRIARLDKEADHSNQFTDRIDPLAIRFAESIRTAMLRNDPMPLILEENAISLFECAAMDSAPSGGKVRWRDA